MSAAQPAHELANKLEATLTAKAALAGWQLVRLADGTFVACRWNHTRHLPDLWAASKFFERAGVL